MKITSLTVMLKPGGGYLFESSCLWKERPKDRPAHLKWLDPYHIVSLAYFDVRKSDLMPEDWASIKALVESEPPTVDRKLGRRSWNLEYGVPRVDELAL